MQSQVYKKSAMPCPINASSYSVSQTALVFIRWLGLKRADFCEDKHQGGAKRVKNTRRYSDLGNFLVEFAKKRVSLHCSFVCCL